MTKFSFVFLLNFLVFLYLMYIRIYLNLNLPSLFFLFVLLFYISFFPLLPSFGLVIFFSSILLSTSLPVIVFPLIITLEIIACTFYSLKSQLVYRPARGWRNLGQVLQTDKERPLRHHPCLRCGWAGLPAASSPSRLKQVLF